MRDTKEVPFFCLQDLQAEIRHLENDLRKANERLHHIQEIIGRDAGSTTAGLSTETLSNRGLHRIPDIIVPDAIGGASKGGPLPEATSSPRAATAENYFRTNNEEGFCPGDRVVIKWDRFFKYGRSTKHMPKTKNEGKLATVTKVTPKFVWADVEGEEGTIKKKSHNITLRTPAVGAERVSIKVKGCPDRLVQR